MTSSLSLVMKEAFLTFILTAFFLAAMAQLTPFERDKTGNVTATYQEVITFYKELDSKYDQMQMLEYGPTDIGKNLNLVVLSKNRIFSPEEIRRRNTRILLINNGIHPGEPEGIDASMLLVRDMLSKNALPDDVVICIIPVYNIDGMLNRGISRVNQNGPESYGFRGNYQNLDLNRDFIKTDSKNSHSFQEIFNIWQPEVFVDNHTSNGADYQYVMTLIHPQKDKLHPVLSKYTTDRMLPALYRGMKESGFEMIPYVNSVEETPDEGIIGFLESPRYSTGYAALHNTIGFMPETHMLKPFAQRVKSTYQFMKSMIDIVQKDALLIGKNKRRADDEVEKQSTFALSWKLDNDQFSRINFKGYTAKYKASGVSGLPRLFYDRNTPYEKEISIRDHYLPSAEAEKPAAYIIPQAWQKVISLLKLNGVQMKRLSSDTDIDLKMYYIEENKPAARPFEGHYINSQVKLMRVQQKVAFYEGDYVVFTDQKQNRYIVETLEPQATDSFFTWNFFDSILGQKEHFSAYVFEDEAEKMLKNDLSLSRKLEEAKKKDPELAKSAQGQLTWLYRNSEYFEKTYRRYPVGRLLITDKLDLK